MKAQKIISIIGIFAMIIVLASPVMAGDGRKDRGWFLQEKISAILENIDLSEAQKTKVDAIVDKHWSEAKTLHKSLGEKEEALAEAIHQAEYKEDAVRAAFQQVSSIKEKLVISRAKMFAALRGVLEPEQMGYFRGRIEAMKDFRRDRRPPKNHRH